jgi:lipopolysaccharide transport system ATP-binding protein
MSDTVIKIEELSKEYRLGVVNHGVLARDIQSWWARFSPITTPFDHCSEHRT